MEYASQDDGSLDILAAQGWLFPQVTVSNYIIRLELLCFLTP